MAFKPIRLTDSASYVSVRDPAIDWEATADKLIAADEALSSSTSLSLEQKRAKVIALEVERLTKQAAARPAVTTELPIKSGERPPLKFVIGVIPPDQMNRISDECLHKDKGTNELCWRAFCASLRGLEGWLDGDPPTVKVGDVPYVDPAWIRRNFARNLRDVANEVGSVAWLWNQMPADDLKK